MVQHPVADGPDHCADNLTVAPGSDDDERCPRRCLDDRAPRRPMDDGLLHDDIGLVGLEAREGLG